jgi:hypothetical protein
MDKIIPTQGKDESVVLFRADDDCEVFEVELNTIIKLDQCERWFRRRGGRGEGDFFRLFRYCLFQSVSVPGQRSLIEWRSVAVQQSSTPHEAQQIRQPVGCLTNVASEALASSCSHVVPVHKHGTGHRLFVALEGFLDDSVDSLLRPYLHYLPSHGASFGSTEGDLFAGA